MAVELLNMEVPEILCTIGAKGEAKEMIKAHNKMISMKASAFEAKRPDGLIITPKQAEDRAKNKQNMILSSFTNMEYRAAAKQFLEKLLPKAKKRLAEYDTEVSKAETEYNEAAAKYKEAANNLMKCRNKRKKFCNDLGSAAIYPFLYANDGGGVVSRYGRIPERLYVQLGFAIPSYNVEPVEHIEYMLQEIERRDHES